MEPIGLGATGAAVQDIQERLSSLDYSIDATEKTERHFGVSTARAVSRFRLDYNLAPGEVVDAAMWARLVDEGYQLGDRTLYLRLPNLHGNDIRQLQERLNILGFSCGPLDGVYGVHTEAAVKLFQESFGSLADGMAFVDTFSAIERLRHVWSGKNAHGPHPQGGMSFARAANVLETVPIAITADDQISRNVAARLYNLARATTEKCALVLVDSLESAPPETSIAFLLSSTPLPEQTARADNHIGNVLLDDSETLARRLETTIRASQQHPARARIELPVSQNKNICFTTGDAQTLAVMVLDAICSACSGF